MVFSEHLLAYQNSSMLDNLKESLLERLSAAETSDPIKQLIWRILIVGWFKFARDAN